MTLISAADEAVQALEAINAARESALTLSRTLIRQCANTIRAIHRREWDEAGRLAQAARGTTETLRQHLVSFPALMFAGYTQDALKEYVEAKLLLALIRAQVLPSYVELAVEPAAYLNGMAEAASELRRYILDGLRRGEMSDSERLLSAMDDIYTLLTTVDYPDAVTGGLRRSTDALRAVLERTRGDLTTSLQQERLLRALHSVTPTTSAGNA